MSLSYEQLGEEGREFLARCGLLAIMELHEQEEFGSISVNEMLGMATRILAEQAQIVQAKADNEIL